MNVKWNCICGHELKFKGSRQSNMWIGTEISTWCEHCSKIIVLYVDESDTLRHIRTLRDNERPYYGDPE